VVLKKGQRRGAIKNLPGTAANSARGQAGGKKSGDSGSLERCARRGAKGKGITTERTTGRPVAPNLGGVTKKHSNKSDTTLQFRRKWRGLKTVRGKRLNKLDWGGWAASKGTMTINGRSDQPYQWTAKREEVGKKKDKWW